MLWVWRIGAHRPEPRDGAPPRVRDRDRERDRGAAPAARLADDPGFRHALADSYVDALALRCLGYRGFAKFSQGKPAPEHMLLKLFGSEANQAPLPRSLGGTRRRGARHRAQPEHAGRFDEDWPWALRYLGSFGTTISGGTSEIQRNIVAERVLGLPRPRR